MWDFNIQLGIISAARPNANSVMSGIDVSEASEPAEKAKLLSGETKQDLTVLQQAGQLENPECTVRLAVNEGGELLVKQYVMKPSTYTL